ncbi:sensor histidine kinase [Sphingobacterium mizutaii]|uniref:sensor histidine kinase n=1 Tax=Sphingobacterium mizutaii TaxID=1010 RepID=UPI001626CB3F|nr:histidine kinase [Sphingobacterium mizutaii]
MRSEVIWGKWYSPPVRILVHFVFWLLVASLYYLTFLRLGGDYMALFLVKELIVTSSLFYSANWLISGWISKGKVFPILLFFFFSYCWWLNLTYITCYSLKDTVPVSDDRIYKYVKFFTANGYWSIYDFRKIPALIPDFLLLISVPLTPKLVKLLLQDANRMLVLETNKATLELEKAKLELEKATLERDNLSMELQILKSQISPHFLFNTLNSIYQLSEKKDENTSETIMQLSNMLRYMLYQTDDDKIHIEHEIQFLRDYLHLVQIRFGQGVKLTYEIMEINEPYKIVPLILLPFIENAIKHGPDRSRINAWIDLSLMLDEGVLKFNVSNGVNRASKKAAGGGIGLQNVKRRLELWYGDRYTLDISEGPSNYAVFLTIRL